MLSFCKTGIGNCAWFCWINLFWREVLDKARSPRFSNIIWILSDQPIIVRRQCCLVLVSFLRCFEMMASIGVLIVSHRLHSLCKEVVAGKGAFELPSLGITLPIWRWIVIIVNMWVEHHYHHSWLQKVTHHCKHPKEKKNWQTLDEGKKSSSFFHCKWISLLVTQRFLCLFSNLRQKTHFLDKRKCHLNTRSSTK